MEASEVNIGEDKLTAIEGFLDDFEKLLKDRKANLGLAAPVKQYLLKEAIKQARLEGQIYELRIENRRVNQLLEINISQNTNNQDDSVALLHARLEGQIDILREENRRLSEELEEAKQEITKLKAENIRIENEVKELTPVEKARLEAEIEGLKIANTKIRAENEAVKTYASVTATAMPQTTKTVKAIETKMQKVKDTNLIFIKPTNNQNTKQVEEALIKTINPKEDKVKIKGIRKTPNTVIIETASKEDSEKIKQKAATIEDIRCEDSRKRRPMVVVYQVPTSMEDKEFMDQLYQINLCEDMTMEEFKKEAVIKFKTGRRDRRSANNIIEVSPRLWHLLLHKDRVYIQFESLKVKDFVRVARCYTCHDLGHSSRQCKLREPVCYKCAKPGHIQADCKNEQVGCIPCNYRKKKCNKAGGADCPTYKHFYSRQIETTDYDHKHHG